MVRDIRHYKNRISLLESRPKDNQRIIAKLKRKIKILERKMDIDH
jgi:hypothetical protein